MNASLESIQNQIDNFKSLNPDESVGCLSDTYHSFDDLYKHRAVLTALAMLHMPYAWKSKTHEDGSMYDGMFIVGAPTPDGMISYHYDLEYWDLFKIPTLPHAPEFTGYTEEDVLNRLEHYINLNIKSDDHRMDDIVKEEILPTFGDDLISSAAFIGFYNS